MAKRHRALRKTLLSFFLKCSKNQKLMRNSNLRDFRISSFGYYMGQSIGRQPLKNLWKICGKICGRQPLKIFTWSILGYFVPYTCNIYIVTTSASDFKYLKIFYNFHPIKQTF